ncbi:MAG: permease prefix domain 1-containing protein [Pseudomonadales bacterium]
MFDLNQAIARWRVYMKRSGHVLPDELDELESHLRETCDHLIESGISLEEAFATASNQIGEPMEVGAEFQKNKGKLRFFATNTGFTIVALALFHLSAQVLCILFSYGASMQSFETSAEPSFGAKLVDLVTTLLSFPLVLHFRRMPQT